jgi:OmpA-OmpF porin, OOP family
MDNCPETPSGVDVDDSGCLIDSDDDGVPDNMDQCPRTRTGMKVDASGCPLDSDGDDVPDALDKCPDTPAGTTVDGSGCPHTLLKSGAASWIFSDISFNTGKADISPNSYSMLDEIAAALIARPHLKIVVEGHTDNTGTKAVNMDLSQRRAQSVVDYLETKGISASRLSAKGFGPDRPIADNATKQGRARNRRVEFIKVDD